MTDKLEFSRVMNGDLPVIWPEISQYVKDTIKYSAGRYTEKTIVDLVISGFMQLWVVTEGQEVLLSMVTQIMNYPTGLRVCDIILLGGKNIEKWLEFTEKNISEWALNTMNCNSIQLIGRKGWEKMLKKLNWNPMFSMIEKSLKPLQLQETNHG